MASSSSGSGRPASARACAKLDTCGAAASFDSCVADGSQVSDSVAALLDANGVHGKDFTRSAQFCLASAYNCDEVQDCLRLGIDPAPCVGFTTDFLGEDDAVGAELGISINSVRTYVRSVYAKLSAETKTAAVLLGVQSGWLVP